MFTTLNGNVMTIMKFISRYDHGNGYYISAHAPSCQRINLNMTNMTRLIAYQVVPRQQYLVLAYMRSTACLHVCIYLVPSGKKPQYERGR